MRRKTKKEIACRQGALNIQNIYLRYFKFTSVEVTIHETVVLFSENTENSVRSDIRYNYG